MYCAQASSNIANLTLEKTTQHNFDQNALPAVLIYVIVLRPSILNYLVTMMLFVLLCTPSAYAIASADDIYASMQKQKRALPALIRGDLYLTDIVVKRDEQIIQRVYDYLTLDYGKMSANDAKRLSRSIKNELLQQCFEHQELIYGHDIRFYYHLRDRNGRVMLLESINKHRCTRFAFAHAWKEPS